MPNLLWITEKFEKNWHQKWNFFAAQGIRIFVAKLRQDAGWTAGSPIDTPSARVANATIAQPLHAFTRLDVTETDRRRTRPVAHHGQPRAEWLP